MMFSAIENPIAFLADMRAELLVLLTIIVALLLVFCAHMTRAMSPPCPRCRRRHSEGTLCASCQSQLETHHLRLLGIDLQERDLT